MARHSLAVDRAAQLRVLRFFRVIKLVRLVRAARIFARWENKLEINYNSLQLAKSVTAAVVVSHWIACMWLTQVHLTATPSFRISLRYA